jgi:aminomethyltransferase
VELFPHRAQALEIWEGILTAGAANGVRPAGLGARDTLRLEKGFLLSGQDFDGTRTPLEAGCGWLVKWKHEFVGREALRAQKEDGNHERLVGVLLEERGVPRHGCEILREGRKVGVLTSGTLSPSLKRGIGLGYVTPDAADPGTEVAIRVRDRPLAARIVKPPFV